MSKSKVHKWVKRGKAKNLSDYYPFDVASRGDIRAVKRLVRHGFDVKSTDSSWGWTMLGHAARYGQYKVVEFLLSLNVDGLVDHHDEDFATPLHLACENFHHAVRARLRRMPMKKIDDTYFKIAKLLIDHGTDIHYMDCTGNTAYSRALGGDYRNERIITMLEQMGCGESDLYGGSAKTHVTAYVQSYPRIKDIGEIAVKYMKNKKFPYSVLKECVRQKRQTWYDDEDIKSYENVLNFCLDHNRTISLNS